MSKRGAAAGILLEMNTPPETVFDSRTFLANLTTQPGVYRMYAAGGALLYVGKARNLKKRVASYFLRASGDSRIESMVGQIHHIDISVTHTEDEALLLEATLIKELAPRYNVSLRDDKSYPYLRISDHGYPRISFYRGARQGKDRYFGPFPSSASVRETLTILQKLFKLRPCTDIFYANRRRPCLQHQIGRCSAPCVGLINEADYAAEVAKAVRLLEGKGDELVAELGDEMERTAAALSFEKAAQLRDQIAALKRVREHRNITGGADDLDVIALAPHASSSAVAVVAVRDGLNLGHASFFPRHPSSMTSPELLSGFIAQYYLQRSAPREILVSVTPEDSGWLEAVLAERAGHRVRIYAPVRGAKLRLLQMCEQTASQALAQRLAATASMDARLLELAGALELAQPPTRMECFDISHTRGERAVASCVVFNESGPLKAAYRHFNIEGIIPGDDYAAIRQAVSRRYARIKAGEAAVPDVLFIDGGKGQLSEASDALAELQLEQAPLLVGIAKGPSRRPGLEQLFIAGRQAPLMLPPESPALHLIQSIRDEAHRFAITGHRGRRAKARITSDLETIEGLGPVRRRALLKTFGGLQQVRRADIDELTHVGGIHRRLAERIYAYFH